MIPAVITFIALGVSVASSISVMRSTKSIRESTARTRAATARIEEIQRQRRELAISKMKRGSLS